MKDTGGTKCILFKDTNHHTLEEAMAYIIIISITYTRESYDAVLFTIISIAPLAAWILGRQIYVFPLSPRPSALSS